MADIVWPADLKPRGVSFYLQPHVGGSESPLNRVTKRYGLSAPRWIARLRFRGGYAGAPRAGEPAGFGARLDALIADLDGGLNRAVFHDWRRPRPSQRQLIRAALTHVGALKDATTLSVAGFAPGGVAFSVGDYVGGDGRPHLVTGGAIQSGVGTILADAAGVATIRFRPPLASAVAPGAPCVWPVTGRFMLMSEDAGDNDVEPGQAVEYQLDFAEDLAR